MDPQIVCTGDSSAVDTRPATACKACASTCPIHTYIAGRCLRNLNASLSPTSDTTYCVACSPCARGEYMQVPCSGTSYGVDDKVSAHIVAFCCCDFHSFFTDSCMQVCKPCAFVSSVIPKWALNQTTCAPGSYLLNECTSGYMPIDTSTCSSCPSNCEAANYSLGKNGQYISQLCSPQTNGLLENSCGNCDGPCAAYQSPQNPGQYISSFCTGKTTTNRQCVSCRTSCANR